MINMVRRKFMRPLNVKLWGCIGLLAGFVILFGCSSSNDLLDQTGTQYSAYAIPQDQDGEDVQEIDVWSHACDTDDESIYPFDVKIVVTTSENTADFYIESYDVNFRPNTGVYCEDNFPAACGCTEEDLTAAQMPDLTGTVLNPKSYSYSSPVIKPSTTTTLGGLLVWTQGDKAYYAGTVLNAEPMTEPHTYLDNSTCYEWGNERQTADLTYDLQVVLHCRTVENVEVTITTPWTPVHFLDVDTCS
jgi:hypothetical protein